MFFDPLYFLFAIPGLIFAFVAQAMVKSAYSKALNIASSKGLTGAEAARNILRAGGINDVKVKSIEGHLTDYYHPLQRVLCLSQENYDGTSLAAIGVAAHEAGHALQHKQKYALMMLRSALVPVASLGSNLAYFVFIIGLLIAGNFGTTLMYAGILLFCGAFIFAIITLPVELNASRRAIVVLTENSIITKDEVLPVKKVLNAAALTYIAGAVQLLLVLLYMIIRARGKN